MAFFTSAVGTLQTLVIALGAGLGIWGAINKEGKIIVPCKYNDITPYAGSERIEADGGYIKDIYDFNGNYLRSEYKW